MQSECQCNNCEICLEREFVASKLKRQQNQDTYLRKYGLRKKLIYDTDTKECSKCLERLPLDAFPVSRVINSKRSYCRKCYSKLKKESR